MSAPLIDHIGILVHDLEAAIARWSAVTGYTFSPIARYRTEHYSDHSNGEPHFHETRLTFSKEGPPYIELMSVAGNGTHGPHEAGVHHLGFRVQDVATEIRRCAHAGVGDDGKALLDDGRVHVWFTERGDGTDGLRFEFIAPFPGPLVADDGSELPTDPGTGRKRLWPVDESE